MNHTTLLLLTSQEGETFRSMYEQGGILASEDASITVLAGSTLGGGTRVNWCASFKTPAHVRCAARRRAAACLAAWVAVQLQGAASCSFQLRGQRCWGLHW
jgi:hypothetical protein